MTQRPNLEQRAARQPAALASSAEAHHAPAQHDASPLQRRADDSARVQAQGHTLAAVFGSHAARPSQGLATDGPVLQGNWKKTLANIVTFGIRKAVVNYQRNHAQGGGNAVPVVPVQTALDEFVQAYEKTRWYHQYGAHNKESIEQHGLMNYEDRIDTFGQDVHGMSLNLGRDSEFVGDQKKGVFMGPSSLLMENKMTSNVARTYMSKDRTKVHERGYEDEAESHEMIYDRKFPGGAVITKNSVPGGNVTTLTIQDLLEQDSPKLDTMLAAVATQYDDPNAVPSGDEMKALLGEAVRTRRLSNAALDNKLNNVI